MLRIVHEIGCAQEPDSSFRISLGVTEFFGWVFVFLLGFTEVTLRRRKINIDPPEMFM